MGCGPALIAYADGGDAPRSAPAVVAGEAGIGEHRVLMGWTPEPRAWLADPGLTGWAVMGGYALAGPIAEGRIVYLPVRLSAMPRMLAGDLRPDIVVVSGVPRGAGYAYRGSVAWAPAATVQARRGVVVEVDDEAVDLGGPAIDGTILATLPRPGGPTAAAARPVDATDLAIASTVASLLPEEPTIQYGPGAMADAILAALDRPVRVWSGLVTDAAARLAPRGLLLGEVTAGYVWGGRPVEELAVTGRLRLAPLEVTHDLSGLSALERFVACNTALQVGLDGSVNIERVAGRLVAGIGGHADYCAAAARSPGGLSVIALRSTAKDGSSTIVARPEVVSTPRCDVDVVVTEHGVADLRNVGDAERSARMVSVAAPGHRAELLGAHGHHATP